MMLSREDILRGLTKLDARAREAGILIDMAVYGGSAMARRLWRSSWPIAVDPPRNNPIQA